MTRNVLALFARLEEAEAAVDDLVKNGFHQDSIRLDPHESRDGLLVTVSAENQTAERASEILNKHHPVDLSQERERTWQGFNEDARESIFTSERSAYRERDPRPELDYGPGASEYLPGKSLEDYDRDHLGIPDAPQPANWKKYEPRFRDHYRVHYAQTGRDWKEYEEAYRFGFETAYDPQYINTTWDSVLAYIKERWRSRMMGKDWQVFQDAVKDGWEAGHLPAD